MNATTVAVDLAKSVFQLALADRQWKVIETHRLTRNHSKAPCALANKLARICYAVLKYHEPYGTPTRREEHRKMDRTAYAVAA